MPRLVAVEASGQVFVEQMQRIWDGGDAVAPIDPRLPPPARGLVERALRVGQEVESDDALVIATSGTNGDPKGVVLTHAALAASARATSARLRVDRDRDHWLACLPLAHIGGLSVVLRSLLTDTSFTVQESFDLDAVAQAATAGATLISVVPTMLQRIDPSPFRCVLLGGAAPLGALAGNVVTTYGLTETGSGISYDGVALDGVEIRIDDGEIAVRGPMLLRCYRDGADPKDSEGWFATGDAGTITPDGRLKVTGRIGDVINTGGEKVWPAAVERVLIAAPGVAEVAVAKRADPDWGERVVAFVVPADSRNPPTLEALRSLVRDQLPAYAAPRELVLVDRLPRTTSGKVRRVDLV
ncbi:MAG TPA: AMP-binding protein [Acidimicrobiales bacterium]|nr:AMP-binding protein [Acidimicrobiales bacterium]